MKKINLIILILLGLQIHSLGQNWASQPVDFDGFVDLFSITSNTIYIVGDDGLIIKTSDGGKSWNQKTSNTTSRINSVYFVDLNNGWVCGDEGILLRTTNGGETWSQLSSGTDADLMSIFFLDKNNGWLCGKSGVILKTTNGGNSWTDASIPGVTNGLRQIYFANSQKGWILVGGTSSQGGIRYTQDGGNSWSSSMSYPVSSDCKIAKMHFVNEYTGFAVGYNFDNYKPIAIKTTDGGVNFTNINPTQGQLIYEKCRLLDVFFLTENLGYAVGAAGNTNQGIIIKTTDGGASWYSVYVDEKDNSSEIFESISFSNNNAGFVIANRDLVIHKGTPLPPINLVASSSSSNIKLWWDDNGGWSDYFKIERSFNSTNSFDEIVSSCNDTEYSDKNLSEGTYYYRVTGCNNNGCSDYSSIVHATIQGTSATLSINPTTATISATTGTVSGSINVTSNVQWTAVSSASWLTFTSNSTATGNGVLDYKCADNTSTNARTATITFSGNGVANQTATITQKGTTVTTCGKLFQRFPQNNATGMPQSMKFDWEDSHVNNVTYELDITTSDGNYVFNNSNITNSEYQFAIDTFFYNQSYKWKVRALLNGSPITNWSDERVFTIKSESPTSPSYGAALGHLNDAVIYKNLNNFKGHWQCVEYVKRYHNKVYGLNMPAIGNADAYFWSSRLGFSRFNNRNSFIPQVGDLVCLSGGKYGHVAIVKKVEFSDDGNRNNDFVYIAQQNVGTNIGNHINQQVKLSYGSGKFYIHSFAGKRVQGWRRVLPTIITPANNQVFNTTNVLVKWVKATNSKKYKVYISKLNESTGCYESIPNYNGATVYKNYYYFPKNLLEANSKYRFRVGVVTAFNGYVQTEHIYFEIGNVNKSGNDNLYTNLTVKTQKQVNSNYIVDASNILIQTIYKNMYLDEGYTNESGILGFETAPALNVGDIIVASGAGIITKEVILTEEMLNSKNVSILLQAEENYEDITDANVEILNYQPIFTKKQVQLKITAKNHNSFRIIDFENSNDTVTAYNEYQVSDSLVKFNLINKGENQIYVRFFGQDTIDIVKTVIYNPKPSSENLNTVTIISDNKSLNSQIFVNGTYLKNTSNKDIVLVPLGVQEFTFMKENYASVFVKTDTTGTINLSMLETGIEKKLPLPKISIYPNPARDLISVNLDNYANKKIELRVFDAMNRIIKTLTTNQRKVQINTSDLTSGVYYIRVIINSNHTVTEEVVIMK